MIKFLNHRGKQEQSYVSSPPLLLRFSAPCGLQIASGGARAPKAPHEGEEGRRGRGEGEGRGGGGGGKGIGEDLTSCVLIY
ncbi:hypothetical protein E2C01_100344 [Portunus trituberculatus]|uniref:Uncharacterized protein n=1 Tax=Portunus trituberculatus TaxID=210409 RepID=A0A5B7KCU3_PORTR|nr:hypothetical protein [Portunus trituberculatus]